MEGVVCSVECCVVWCLSLFCFVSFNNNKQSPLILSYLLLIIIVLFFWVQKSSGLED